MSAFLRLKILTAGAVFALAHQAIAAPDSVTLEAHNPLDRERVQALVCIDAAQLPQAATQAFVTDGNRHYSLTPFNCGADLNFTDAAFLADFKSNETKQFNLTWHANAQPAKTENTHTLAELALRVNAITDAEGRLQGGSYVPTTKLTLPANHTVGDRLLKYEGIGWESSKIGYRLYFDHRATIDIFGKQTPALVLPGVGQDGTDYHTLADWGMDVLKVGSSLGIGGPASWHKQYGLHGVNQFAGAHAEIFNSPLGSGALVDYNQWQSAGPSTNLQVQYWILPEQALTRVTTRTDAALPHWATGIVNHKVEELHARPITGWGYLATWGKQSLADDNLGMAVFFPVQALSDLQQNETNHLAILKGGPNTQYYFGASWRDEEVTDKRSFVRWLKRQQQELNHPITTKIINRK
ncbi:DUF4861 domain-containing protein [Simiduia sp. 21SJ11W-1]|uniref:DUF4861 family protein n=1 Tax=Simiduia sp. 21SJ11W-1 TaxID=2909669 RepID=UPI0020A1F7D2|nr:DUF4861 family protein [Simiduia sp. 21SJ11W-1]UTA48651.1 DUF4861 domain-containing protein [Simiduia sp. 21SJ11W-1]